MPEFDLDLILFLNAQNFEDNFWLNFYFFDQKSATGMLEHEVGVAAVPKTTFDSRDLLHARHFQEIKEKKNCLSNVS